MYGVFGSHAFKVTVGAAPDPAGEALIAVATVFQGAPSPGVGLEPEES